MKGIVLIVFLTWTANAYAVEAIPATPHAKETLYNDLTSSMACLCGCGTTLKTCPHENCNFGIPAKDKIRKFVDSGLGREEIKAKMVAQHGEAILAQPRFAGFNIMAWVFPFFSILLVGYLLGTIIKKWSSRKSPLAVPPSKGAEKRESDPYFQKMREELKRFEE